MSNKTETTLHILQTN